MPDRPKRVAAIHDLSGFGRCSLSVILPTLSVMGVQVCPVPTTVFPPTPADWLGGAARPVRFHPSLPGALPAIGAGI
mgnify:CR=1 FL=1